MSRRTKEFVVTDPGRDLGKRFLITEMPADQGERWTSQVGLLMAKASGTTFDTDGGGAAGLAAAGIGAGILRALQDPSVDADVWSCIQYIHADKNPPQPIFTGINSQIEEIRTRSLLRIEVLQMHVGFFSTEKASTSERPAASTD